MSIESVCKALGRYYESLDKPYDNLFTEYCEENGFEDLDEELAVDPEDCLLVEFDEKFPFAKEPPNRPQAIFDMIRKCLENPNITFAGDFPTIDQDLFNIDEKDLEDIKKRYQEQCPVLWNSGMSTDGGFLQVLAVAKKNNFDYLLHLVDDYSRDRIKHIDEKNGWPESEWIKNHKHFRTLKNLTVNVPEVVTGSTTGKIKMKPTKCDKIARGAVISFGKRCTPKLIFSNMMSINDSLETTAQFIDSSITFISNLAQKPTTICPFQIDMCIAVGPPAVSENSVQGGGFDGDSDDDDDDDDDDEKYGAADSGDFVDCIGPIESKLKKNKLKYKFSPQDLTKQARMFDDVYKEFVDEHKLQGSDDKTDYLHKKRLIAFVDRRPNKNGKRDDQKSNVYMYEPPKDCAQIPKDVVPEWCISAARTCLLPNMEYKEEVAVTDDANKGNKKEQKEDNNEAKLKNSNIGASFHAKGGLITFSYYVKAQDVIKCYLYWNGQLIRFMPEDIKTVLPKLFNMDYGDNKGYIEDKSGDLDKMIKAMQTKLVDNEFKAFQQSYL